MASIFDDMPDMTTALGDTGLSFYDADTLYDDKTGQGYRLQGVNALEVDTLGKTGQVGGNFTTDQVVRLANDLGYTNVVKLGKVDATGSREMIDLRDAQGRSFSRALAESNLAPVMAGFDPNGTLSQAARYSRAMQSGSEYQANDFDKASAALQDYLTEQEVDRYNFKQKRFMPGMNGDNIEKYAGSTFSSRDIDDITGKSLSPLSTAWDTAMNGVADAAFGITHMMGETLGSDTLKEIGYAGSERARDRIKQEGKILTDYKDVKSFGDAVDFVANNVAMSIPYMAITALSAAAAAPTMGASLLAPVSIYTGQIWNEMGDQIKNTDKERSAGIALFGGTLQAALDLAGVKLLTGVAGKTRQQLFAEATDHLVSSGQYATKEAAENYLMTQTKRGLAEATGDAAKAARTQLDKKALVTDLLGRSAEGFATESSTEAMQEAIAAIAADVGSDSVIDWNDVGERAMQGFVAGGVLGSTFSTAGAAWDAGEWANIAYGVAPEASSDVAENTKYAREEAEMEEVVQVLGADGKPMVGPDGKPLTRIRKRGYTPTIDEVIDEVDAMPDAVIPADTRVDAHEKAQKNKSFKETMYDMLTSTPKLFRSAPREAIPKEVQRKSRTARMLAGMIGAHQQRIYGGAFFEEAIHDVMTVYKNMVDIPENFFAGLNGGQRVASGQEIALSDYFYDQVIGKIDANGKRVGGAIDANGNFDPNLLTETDPAKIAVITKMVAEADALANKMYDDQVKYNPKLNKMSNYLLRFRALDKGAVHKNRSEFIDKLRKIPLANGKYLTESQATKLTDQILTGEQATLDEAFDVLKGGYTPGSHKSRRFNLAERAEFDKFMERDLYANLSQAAKSASRYQATQKYIGKNGEKLSKMYDQMQREGLTEEEVNSIAYKTHQFFQAQSGNYKRPTSDMGKFFEAVQKNFMVFVTITALPLATISSLIDLAAVTRGLTKEQIFGGKDKKGSLSYMAKEFAETIFQGMLEVARLPQAAAPSANWNAKIIQDNTRGRKRLRNAGFYEWDVGAANTVGVSETHSWHVKLLNKFFKWTGLQGWTNFARASRAAFAADFILDNAKIYLSQDPSKVKTNEVRESEEKLRNLGIPLHKLKDLMTVLEDPREYDAKDDAGKALEDSVAEYMRLATFNFVNDAVPMPMASNRPLIYQDPRFALFMQFQGYMATFTSHHIPRLYDEYIKRGSPAMKYQTFAMMTTMIMLGFVSQYLKDLIKFGGRSPYLDEAEYIQRGVLASGLMGTPERLFNQVFPIYETRTNGPVDWIWETTSGESPTIGKAKQLASGAGSLITGDTADASKQFGRAALGPFYQPLKWAFDNKGE